MAATSSRVRHIVNLVGELTEEERAELETELLAEDAGIGRAWGEEIDRRAERALHGEATGISRQELGELLAMPTQEARARLSKVLTSGK